MSVAQSLCGLGRIPGVICVSAGSGGGVNLEDKELGQPRQVMAAGTHRPSGQLMFDLGATGVKQ